jgi:hypothetical protein
MRCVVPPPALSEAGSAAKIGEKNFGTILGMNPE